MMAGDLELWQDSLRIIEEEILVELRKDLAELTSPDYKAEDNPDHELRDEDIEYIRAEIRKYEKMAEHWKKLIEKETASSSKPGVCSLGYDMREENHG